MSIIHAIGIVRARGPTRQYNVTMGAAMSELGAHASNASAGYRLNFNTGIDGFIQDAHNPVGGGLPGESDYAEDRNILSPPEAWCEFFEYKWEQTSKDAGPAFVSPIAISTFGVWNGTKTWTFNQVGGAPSGVKSWVIVVTVQEIADVSNSSSHTMTMQVETL